MSEHVLQHTTILHTDEPVQVVVGQQSDRWHKVLNALYHEGVMAGLRDREYRLLHVMLLLRDEQGFAYAPMADLMRLTGYTSTRNIELARTGLLAHPRRLLAGAGRDRFTVLPGWSFAGRPPDTERTDMRTHVRDGPYMRSKKAHVCSEPAAAAQGSACARPSQPRPELARSKAQSLKRAGGGLAGWPEQGLFDEPDPAPVSTDLRSVLQGRPILLGGGLLERVLRLEGLTVEEIAEELRHIRGQMSAGLVVPNVGGLLASRLLGKRNKADQKLRRRGDHRQVGNALAAPGSPLAQLQKTVNERRAQMFGEQSMRGFGRGLDGVYAGLPDEETP